MKCIPCFTDCLILFQAVLILIFFVSRDTIAHFNKKSDSNDNCGSRDSGVSSGGDLGVLYDADEDAALLSSGRHSYGTTNSPFQYTQDKLDFYAALSKEEGEDGRDVDQVTDVKRTIAMTASGACEV